MGIPRLTGGALTLPFNYPNKVLHSCSCKRRFQVTTGDFYTTRTNDAVETVLAVPHDEWDLISNVHLKQDMDIKDYRCNRKFVPWLRKGNRKEKKSGVTLLEIMRQQISSPKYAFLFAGKTRIGDEKVSDEAIHLAAATLSAGYRGVWKKRGVSRIGMCSRSDETTSGGTSGESEGDGE